MFDVNALAGLPHLLRRRRWWSSATGGGWSGGACDRRTCRRARSANRSFEVLPPAGEDEPLIEPEMHRQRHFPEAEVLAALEGAGLECLDVYGHGEDAVLQQPLATRSTPRRSTSPAAPTARQARRRRGGSTVERYGRPGDGERSQTSEAMTSALNVTGVDFVTVFVTDYPGRSSSTAACWEWSTRSTTGKSPAARSRPAA